MPATRTISRQKAPISSSTTILTPLSPSATLNRHNTDKTSKKPVVLREVIEISSDEDDSAPQINSAVIDLRRQVKRLKEENARIKAQLEAYSHEFLSAENEMLNGSSNGAKGKLTLNISEFEENISCEICTMHMWSPFLLPECGHTFCVSCLQDWFSTTLTQFMTAYPQYNGVQHQNQRLWGATLQNPMIRNPQAAYHAQMRQAQAPQPQYTCPTCREPVKNRPVEDFALKTLIRTIATATGESSPKKAEKQSKGKASTSNMGHWDGFFPQVT